MIEVIYVFMKNKILTAPIFKEFASDRDFSFKKNSHAEFHENPTNVLVSYTKSRMDVRVDVVVHSRFPFFTS